MEAPIEKYLSRREVAELFDVPEKTVAQWAFKKTGPPVYRIGRYARYKLSECLTWADAQQTGGSDAA